MDPITKLDHDLLEESKRFIDTQRREVAAAKKPSAIKLLFDRSVSLIAALFLVWMAGYLCYWAYYSFFATPDKDKNPPNLAVQAIEVSLIGKFPENFPNLNYLENGNLEIYITKKDFEYIPFPDREQVLLGIFRSWGRNVDHTYMPVIKLRDIRTGAEFARYSCYRDKLELAEIQQ